MIYFPQPVVPDFSRYAVMASNAIILAADGRLCLQRRTLDAPTAPGGLSFWGGGVEAEDASFIDTMQRELQEELGVDVSADELVYLGAHETEKPVGLVLASRYFWHDRHGLVRNCYEGAIEYHDNVASALAQTLLHRPGTLWCLEECLRRGLIT